MYLNDLARSHGSDLSGSFQLFNVAVLTNAVFVCSKSKFIELRGKASHLFGDVREMDTLIRAYLHIDVEAGMAGFR